MFARPIYAGSETGLDARQPREIEAKVSISSKWPYKGCGRRRRGWANEASAVPLRRPAGSKLM